MAQSIIFTYFTCFSQKNKTKEYYDRAMILEGIRESKFEREKKKESSVMIVERGSHL